MRTYLGIDGGGTKTSWRLADEKGKTLASLTSSTIHFRQIGSDGVKQALAEGFQAILRQSGLEASDLNYTFLGLPGYGEFRAEMAGQEEAAKAVFGRRVTVANDAVVGWAGSLGLRPGLNMVLGTGAVCYGRDAFGGEARAGGWGPSLGDEGSAYWLGREALSLFTRQSDGRLKGGRVLALLREHFSLQDDFDLIEAAEKLGREATARLALILAEAAGQGDDDARGAFERAAQEAVLTIAACAGRLRLPDPIPVSFSGGVIKAGRLIREPLEKALAASSFHFRIVDPIYPPDFGAVLAAMAADGLSVENISMED